MTDARLGGLGREALVADSGQVRLGGLVREALVAGIGLSGTITSKAKGRSSATVVFAGVILSASAKAQSRSKAGPLSLHINIAGRIKARSSIRAGVQSTLVLNGRATTRSSARLLEVHAMLAVMSGRATATSGAGTFAIVASTRTRQYAVSIINS
jgi:hypothetical protein